MRSRSLLSSWWLLLFVICALCAIPAAAQKAGVSAYFAAYLKANAADINNARGYGNVGFNPDIMSIPGKPFTATRIYTEAGSSVEVTVARDKVGRVHYESAAPEGGPIGVVIYDPIAHTLSRYSIARDHGIDNDATATVTRLAPLGEMSRPAPSSDQALSSADNPAGDGGSTASGATASVAAPAATVPANKVPAPADLPQQVVNGIAAIGQRSVEKYGSEQQFFMIQEEWFSPEYAINLRQSVWRQNKLDSSVETRDLAAGDPDPDLFRVPGGYSIVSSQ